jgi:hypothetical protein
MLGPLGESVRNYFQWINERTIAYLKIIVVQVSNPIRSWTQVKEDCDRIRLLSQKPQSKTAVGDMYTHLGVRDVINKTIVDQKYSILAKKDAASSSERCFLAEFTNLDVQGTQEVFNPFFKLDCKF